MISAKLDYSSVSLCVKQIARLILAHDRQPGYRLPTQEALRRILGASNDTLSAAMARLVEMGVVTRKPLVGTVVADQNATEGINWSVGLTAFIGGGPSAFYSDLHHRLLIALAHAHCRTTTYFRAETYHIPSRISDFPGLAEDVANRHLDGVLTMTSIHSADCRKIENEGIPIVRVGSTITPHLFGVVIDAVAFEREAAEALMQHGCKRCALATTLGVQTPVNETNASPFYEVIRQQAGIEGGRITANYLLEQPRDRRPDGLAITDDYAAMGLTRVLADNREYRPCIAVMTCRQLPLEFSMPVIRLDFDSDELVAKAVALLKTRITGRSVKQRVQTVTPRLTQLG